MDKYDLSNWEENYELNNWLQDVKPKTRSEYLSVFRVYQGFTGLSPRQLIDEAEEELKLPRRERGGVKKRLLSFYDYLVKEYRPKKGRNARKGKPGISRYRAKKIVEGTLASFYKKNGFPQYIKVAEASPKKENFRVELSPGEVKRLVAKANSFRDRAIILTGYQGGLDAKTTTLLDVADLPEGLLESIESHRGDFEKVLKDYPSPWLLHIVREKEGINFHTCMGWDAAENIILSLWERISNNEELNIDSPLFSRVATGFYLQNNTRERRIEERHIHNLMKKLAVNSGIISKERLERADINPVGFHALRSSFSRILEASGMPKSYIDYMQGHKLEFNGAYSRPNSQKLKEVYKEHEHRLSISSTSSLGEVDKKLEDMKKSYNTVIEDLQRKNKALESRVKALEEEQEALKDLAELKKRLVKLEKKG